MILVWPIHSSALSCSSLLNLQYCSDSIVEEICTSLACSSSVKVCTKCCPLCNSQCMITGTLSLSHILQLLVINIFFTSIPKFIIHHIYIESSSWMLVTSRLAQHFRHSCLVWPLLHCFIFLTGTASYDFAWTAAFVASMSLHDILSHHFCTCLFIYYLQSPCI